MDSPVVTYQALFQFVSMLTAVIALVITIERKNAKK